ncbi:MAG: hypothetical protein EU530_11545, partial [Promethearchaeota archaeon]
MKKRAFIGLFVILAVSCGALIFSFFYIPQTEILFENNYTLTENTRFVEHYDFPVRSHVKSIFINLTTSNEINVTLFNSSEYSAWINNDSYSSIFHLSASNEIIQEIPLSINVRNNIQKQVTLMVVAINISSTISYTISSSFSRQ